MRPSSGQAELAYNRIKVAVLSGEFDVGQTLSENQLAELCSVSRTPVREAVQRLEMERVLVRFERSLLVPDPPPEEIYEIYEAQSILLAAAARLAAERRTELDLANLDHIIHESDHVESLDVHQVIEFNLNFWRAVWRSSHNRILMEMLERMGMPAMQRFGGTTTLSEASGWERACRLYSDLRSAIAERDGCRAAELSERQSAAVRDARIQRWHSRRRELAAGSSAVVSDPDPPAGHEA